MKVIVQENRITDISGKENNGFQLIVREANDYNNILDEKEFNDINELNAYRIKMGLGKSKR